MKSVDELPKISVLFVTYNRSQTLVPTYESFLASTDYPRDRLELILCDDGSNRFHRDIIERLPFDIRIFGKNAGLGANCNRGLEAATGDLILQLQDDWLLTGDGDYLRKACRVLDAYDDIGMVLFRDRPELTGSTTRELDGLTVRVLEPHLDACGVLVRVGDGAYSDNPHLKRREFHAIVGGYADKVPMTEMELRMSRAIAAQSRYKVATVDGLEVFEHIGAPFSFNPGARRQRRLDQIVRMPGGGLLLQWLRRVRHRNRK